MGVNRRSFIRYASLAAAGNAAGLRPFGALNSLAQGATDYKALVCVFLFGGNDANNTLMPFDTSGVCELLVDSRAACHSADAAADPTAQAPNFSLNPNLPDIAKLFDSKAAALVTNVGTLIAPTTKAQYQAGRPAGQSLLAPRPTTGVAERVAERGDIDRMGRADRGHSDGELQPGRASADDYVCGGRHAVLQWSGEHAGVGESGKPGRRRVQRGCDGVCRAAGHGAGAAAVRLGTFAGAGGQYDHKQRL